MVESLTRDVARRGGELALHVATRARAREWAPQTLLLMNFAQKDIERTLDPDALQHETTLNDIGATQKRLEQDTQRH